MKYFLFIHKNLQKWKGEEEKRRRGEEEGKKEKGLLFLGLHVSSFTSFQKLVVVYLFACGANLNKLKLITLFIVCRLVPFLSIKFQERGSLLVVLSLVLSSVFVRERQ
jgi:hypothetical protein